MRPEADNHNGDAGNPEHWQRARTSDQKAQRIKAIEDAAGELFVSHPYHKITTAMIAGHAGFTRPNLYRYFRTKEEIFLSLLGHDMDAWISHMQRDLSEGRVSTDIGIEADDLMLEDESAGFAEVQRVARWWTDTLCAQPRLRFLLALLSSSLEENSSAATLRTFKLQLWDQVQCMGEILMSVLPWFPENRVTEFATVNMATVSGYTHMAQRGPVHERVLEEAGLTEFSVDFYEAYRAALSTWLWGVRCFV